MIKKTSSKIMLIAALFTLSISSCKKSDTGTATIVYMGAIEADGCGWLVKLDSNGDIYSPTNLSDAYEKANLKVTITYTILSTKSPCSANDGTGYTQMDITSIK